MEAGETITVSATYTPRSASVDKTIRVNQRGDYTLAIRNNSSNTVSVSGFVNY